MNNSFLENIIRIRRQKNFSQSDIASFLNISLEDYINVELGNTNISKELQHKLSIILDLNNNDDTNIMNQQAPQTKANEQQLNGQQLNNFQISEPQLNEQQPIPVIAMPPILPVVDPVISYYFYKQYIKNRDPIKRFFIKFLQKTILIAIIAIAFLFNYQFISFNKALQFRNSSFEIESAADIIILADLNKVTYYQVNDNEYRVFVHIDNEGIISVGNLNRSELTGLKASLKLLNIEYAEITLIPYSVYFSLVICVLLLIVTKENAKYFVFKYIFCLYLFFLSFFFPVNLINYLIMIIALLIPIMVIAFYLSIGKHKQKPAFPFEFL